MRTNIARLKPKTYRFEGKITKFGWGFPDGYDGYPKKTVMLSEIKIAETGEVVADHMWFRNCAWAKDIPVGTYIRFYAKPKKYIKGWRKDEEKPERASEPMEDYKLDDVSLVIQVGG